MIIDKSKLQPLLWAVVGAWRAGDQDLHLRTDALDEFLGESTVEEVALGLLEENERLAANLKLNLCDYPAIHDGDLDLLIASVEGASQIDLAKANGCTPPNISRKVRRVKQRLGWQQGMRPVEIRARAEQLRALASQGAVVTADLMVERDQLKAENKSLRGNCEAMGTDMGTLTRERNSFRRNAEKLKAENEALRASMKEMCAMYTHVWDREDGALVCFSSNVERFDKAHEAAWALIDPAREATHG